ncbi:MAG: hypothetical protein M1826_004974 [Phylliscum demangeonii]|nr:MAG: hypothetical protein M1826_004974 [Phylliscum demangeonii]
MAIHGIILGCYQDIIKVRLQTTEQYRNAIDCATRILREEGPLAFYKVSVQFGAFHEARRRFEAYNARKGSSRTSPSLTQYYLSGAIAGIANTAVSAPIEHVRIRLQTQPHQAAQRLYAGPIDCIRQLASQQGVFRGLFRGTSITLLREAQAYGVWFLTFEYLMQQDAARSQVTRRGIPSWKVALYGGLAGEALWLASYPLDVVKSKMQTDGFGTLMKYPTMRSCFAHIWRVEGLRGFWKGIGPTLLRAMPVSAGTFAV